MCGFAGFFSGAWPGDAAPLRLKAMTDAIAHRGPDSEGQWLDADAAIALGHRRLSIVELSAAGAQPMQSASGRYVIAFNGEIYNHLDLRAALEQGEHAPRWRGHCDTETLLAGFDAWGIRATVELHPLLVMLSSSTRNGTEPDLIAAGIDVHALAPDYDDELSKKIQALGASPATSKLHGGLC